MAVTRAALQKNVASAIRHAIASTSTRELVEGALGPLASAFGCSSLILYRQFGNRFESHVPGGWLNGMNEYAALVDRCPLQEVKRRFNPRIAIMSDLLDGRTYRSSEMFNEVFRPLGMERQIVARLSDIPFGQSGVCGLVLCRSEHDREWTRDDERELSHAMPLLSASVERNARYEQLQIERDIFATALGRADGSPMLLFRSDGRLIWMSPKAAALLSAHLRRQTALDEPFRGAVHGLLALQTSPDLPRAITLEVAAGAGGPSLRAGLFSVRSLGSDELFVIVALEERGLAPELVALGAARFGLTQSEIAVVRELASGAGTRSIGLRLHISHETVRTHLKRIYEKMDVHSRVELLARMRSLRAYY
jgi:DNA-binding CsgD family transcriptional regulator